MPTRVACQRYSLGFSEKIGPAWLLQFCLYTILVCSHWHWFQVLDWRQLVNQLSPWIKRCCLFASALSMLLMVFHQRSDIFGWMRCLMHSFQCWHIKAKPTQFCQLDLLCRKHRNFTVLLFLALGYHPESRHWPRNFHMRGCLYVHSACNIARFWDVELYQSPVSTIARPGTPRFTDLIFWILTHPYSSCAFWSRLAAAKSVNFLSRPNLSMDRVDMRYEPIYQAFKHHTNVY